MSKSGGAPSVGAVSRAKIAEMAAEKVMDGTKVTEMHAIEGDGGYQSGLRNVTDTTKTVDNVLTTFSDPRKMVGAVFLMITLAVVLWFARRPIKKLWEEVSSPIKNLIHDYKEEQEVHEDMETSRVSRVEDLTIDGTAESQDKELTDSDAKKIAETIANCWGWLDDQEDIVIMQLRQIPGPKSFRKVDMYYRQQHVKYHDGLFSRTVYTSDLMTDIKFNMGDNIPVVIEILEEHNIDVSALKK